MHVGNLTSLLDGNHKLTRWRMVIHGAIDGFFRLIVYLMCSNNNKASTVLGCYKEAVTMYGVPKRVRMDKGGENVSVARFMLEKRGIDSNPVITGSSVHNQRIERLWYDVWKSVTQVYYRLFYYMEDIGILNPLDERHLFALHYIFIPRLCSSLAIFSEGWNNHTLSSSGRTPLQLYTQGRITQLVNDDFTTAFNDIDIDAPIAVDIADSVHVPEVQVVLSADTLAHVEQIRPLEDSNSFGIDLYGNVLHVINHS